MEHSIGSYKSIAHMVLFFVVMLKVQLIDKKLRMLEKRILHK